MFRPRRAWCLLGAVLAVLLGMLSAPDVPAAPDAPAVAAPPLPVASAPAAFAAHAGARAPGPSCDPAAPDRGAVPVAPPRGGYDHAQVPVGRPAPEGVRPHGTMPVRVLVRGPDRPAPGPVELSVMRV
uniref:Uncharacterized protein n=1 Tax=Streptomyces sp. NBC_00049 TaxID=2903617 RepID=A0AAU2JT50_9ACTN